MGVNNITQSGARVIMMGTKPEPDTKNLHKKYRQYDAKVGQFAKSSKGSVAFVDVYSSFAALGNPGNLYAADDLHMSKKGYTLWDTWAATAHGDASGCAIWKSGKCTWPEPPVVKFGKNNRNTCPEGFSPILSERACRAAMPLIKTGDPHHFL